MLMSKTEWLLSAPVSATNSKADTPLFPYLVQLMRGEDMSSDEAAGFFRALTDLNANPAQISARSCRPHHQGRDLCRIGGHGAGDARAGYKNNFKAERADRYFRNRIERGQDLQCLDRRFFCRRRRGAARGQTNQPGRSQCDRQRRRAWQAGRKSFRRAVGSANLPERRRPLFYVRAQVSPHPAARRRYPQQSGHPQLS